MRNVRGLTAVLCSVALLGCEGVNDPETSEIPRGELARAHARHATGVVAGADGGGQYLLAGFLDIQFSLSAVRRADGKATGRFHQALVFDGQRIDFLGEVTCLTVDPVNHRAWIGGVVLRNNSEHPDFLTDITEPGDDVWFRVLDNGGGQAEADRTTFLGFEGDIITSEEYCATMPWPDDNARTHPVTRGGIAVRP